MAQLLIDMPAESASRLLTLSLLEQLSVHGAYPAGQPAVPDTARDTAAVATRGVAYRAVLNRLRGCVVLYDEMLSESISRKVRRRLRSIAKAANTLHDVDVQLIWLAQPDHAGQAKLAAQWLADRLARRRERFASRLAQVQEDARPLKRLAKRMSVYTTAIHLDEMNVSLSFGALTGQRLAAAGTTLRAAISGMSARDGASDLRRVRRVADHLVYLLEPVRSTADVEPLTEMAHELRIALERLRETIVVSDVLLAGARRIGALQMVQRVRRAVEPADLHSGNGDGTTPPTASVLPDEIAPGLLSLAERLREERAHAFAEFATRWLEPENAAFFAQVEHVAVRLGNR
ncbi:MAG TPA: CHAD domain-containing protein [Gemmatimonadaceae bacterium]|nr:CHAD domain-containing protein [Gemmatimonadaceae bacterium]